MGSMDLRSFNSSGRETAISRSGWYKASIKGAGVHGFSMGDRDINHDGNRRSLFKGTWRKHKYVEIYGYGRMGLSGSLGAWETSPFMTMGGFRLKKTYGYRGTLQTITYGWRQGVYRGERGINYWQGSQMAPNPESTIRAF